MCSTTCRACSCSRSGARITRLSIRGSGLSRNFHLRGIQLYHGRHPDQHRRRLRRFPGDRSERLSLRRGLQGRQRAALRRQLARRRDQFRDADRPRCRAVRRARRRRQLRLPPSAGELAAARAGRSITSSPAPGRSRTASATTAAGESTRASANVGYRLSRERRDALLLQRQRHQAAHPRQRDASDARADRSDGGRGRSTSPTTGSATSTPVRIANKTTIRVAPGTMRRVRRLRRRPPPDASDLPVARLPVRGLRRLRPPDRRALHRRLREPLHRRRQPAQRRRSTTSSSPTCRGQ